MILPQPFQTLKFGKIANRLQTYFII